MRDYQYLERFGIPTEIRMTAKFVSSLMRIAAAGPFLDEILATPLKIELLRQAEIRAITYSNQIEGNRLEERAVTILLGANKSKPTDQDEQEIFNYRDALKYAGKLAKEKNLPSLHDYCDIQKLITKNTIPSAQLGRLRTVDVSVVNESTGKVIDACPDPLIVPDLMRDLWSWLRNTEGENPYARAFAFHYISVAIHPFADGNGRSARLFQHLLLLRQGEGLAKYVPSETVVMRNRDEYYSVIRQSKKLSSLHPVLEFMADCFATAIEEVVKEAKTQYEDSKRLDPEARRKRILKFAEKNSPFKASKLAEHLPDVPRRTLDRDLQELVDDRKLKAIGEKRGRAYSLR
jgi:Fic family protein